MAFDFVPWEVMGFYERGEDQDIREASMNCMRLFSRAFVARCCQMHDDTFPGRLIKTQSRVLSTAEMAFNGIDLTTIGNEK